MGQNSPEVGTRSLARSLDVVQTLISRHKIFIAKYFRLSQVRAVLPPSTVPLNRWGTKFLQFLLVLQPHRKYYLGRRFNLYSKNLSNS